MWEEKTKKLLQYDEYIHSNIKKIIKNIFRFRKKEKYVYLLEGIQYHESIFFLLYNGTTLHDRKSSALSIFDIISNIKKKKSNISVTLGIIKIGDYSCLVIKLMSLR